MLFLLIPLLPFIVTQVEGSTSTNKLYAHAETTTIGGSSYYLHLLSSSDGNGTILSASAVTTGRKLMGRWVYPLSGIISIPASAWTVTYRAMKSASASSVVAHGDIDILIRKSDNTIRTTIAANAANSPSLTLINTWQTLTGTYSWAAYTVADQTDYLEVAYYIEVTTPQNSKSVRLLVDDCTLALADQTKVENVILTYPNQAPVASFTFSPSNPLVNDTVTFDASASHDPDGSIVSYRWDFGDGNVTTVTNPIITHVYLTAASTVNYTVTLTVTDNEGSTGIATQIVPVTNPSILHVSLPAGTYVGSDPDHWLSQCWLLNITGLSGTFTLRIDNIHSTIISYDTHLIIALNNAAYQYLDTLTVGVTTIPKSSFVYGTPTPYGFTQTWEEDVYSTWFSDIYNGFGTIDPSSYKEAQVSVTFTNATGVRMHFDAYGSTDSPPPPTAKGHVTHNAHEKDSTVLFYPPAVVQYYLTVTSPYGTVGGQGSYNSGSTAYASLDTDTFYHGNGTRRVFTNWGGDTSGTNYAQSDPIFMDGPKTAIANWKTQYRLIVRTNGLGTYVTSVYNDTAVLGSATDATPYIGWFDDGDLILLNIDSPIVDGSKRFVFTQWSGDAAGTSRPAYVTINTAKDITANYKTQYQITVTASPSGAIGGTFKVAYTQCGTTHTNEPHTTSWTEWVDASTTVAVSEPQDIVNGYKFDHYDPSAGVTMNSAKTITLVYTTIGPLSVSISPTTAKIKIGESVTFTSTVSGGVPGYSYQWYLNGAAVSGAIFSTWTFTPVSTGTYTVYLNVTDSVLKTAKSNEASVTVAPPLTVSISPTSASILVGQSVTFTSTVSGGYPPYSYQWYLNGAPVSGATTSTWTFTPTTSGIHYVYLKVTDANNNVAQSETARITVSTVPVGGYSISLTKQTPPSPVAAYIALIALFGAILSLTKRKRK